MSNSIISIGLQGIQSAMERIGTLAGRITNPSVEGSPAIEDLVQIKVESLAVKASAHVVKTGEELQDKVLDILA